MKRILHALAALWPKGREHEGPWLPDTRNGLLRHAADVMRMEGAIEELMVGKGRLSASQNQHTPKETKETPLLKREILPVDESDSDTGNTLTVNSTLAQLYLQNARSQNETTEESTDTNSEPNVKRHFPMPLMNVFLALFMCLLAVQQVSAQSEPAASAAGGNIPTKLAADVVATGLRIGDDVPDVALKNIINYKTTVAELSEFFNDKVLIIDFWATWCGACVAMMPKLDSLQRELSDNVQFLTVTSQKTSEIEPFLENYNTTHGRPFNIPVITQDSLLKSIFPHRTLPHYVWITTDGKLGAITESKEINKQNILALYNNQDLKLSQKQDFVRDYDRNLPLLFQGTLDNTFYYFSQLSGYLPGISGGTYNSAKREGVDFIRLTVRNASLLRHYQMAYWGGMKALKYVSLQVQNPSAFLALDKQGDEYLDWLKNGNGFCYEIILHQKYKSKLYDLMQSDLERLFPTYRASLQVMEQPHWVLKSKSVALKVPTGGPLINENYSTLKIKNGSVYALLDYLDMAHNKQKFFIDETGINGTIDLELSADFTDMENVNNALAPYGLCFEMEPRIVEMLVIADR